MSRKFNVGDRVRFLGGKQSDLTKEQWERGKTGSVAVPVGTLGTVVPSSSTTMQGFIAVEFDDVQSGTPTGLFQCLPKWLQHVYDGTEKVSWSSCVWQPKNIGVRA